MRAPAIHRPTAGILIAALVLTLAMQHATATAVGARTDDTSRPTLFIHGDDDQIVPIGAAAKRAVELVEGATLSIYAGGAHGLTVIEQDRFNAELLAFAAR